MESRSRFPNIQTDQNATDRFVKNFVKNFRENPKLNVAALNDLAEKQSPQIQKQESTSKEFSQIQLSWLKDNSKESVAIQWEKEKSLLKLIVKSALQVDPAVKLHEIAEAIGKTVEWLATKLSRQLTENGYPIQQGELLNNYQLFLGMNYQEKTAADLLIARKQTAVKEFIQERINKARAAEPIENKIPKRQKTDNGFFQPVAKQKHVVSWGEAISNLKSQDPNTTSQVDKHRPW